MLLHTGLHFHSWRSRGHYQRIFLAIFIINNNPVILVSPEQSNTLDCFFVLIHCWMLFGVEGCLECHYYETTCHWLESVLYSFSHYLSNVCVVWMLNNISIVARIQSESSFTGVGFLPFHCCKNGMENIFSPNCCFTKIPFVLCACHVRCQRRPFLQFSLKWTPAFWHFMMHHPHQLMNKRK